MSVANVRRLPPIHRAEHRARRRFLTSERIAIPRLMRVLASHARFTPPALRWPPWGLCSRTRRSVRAAARGAHALFPFSQRAGLRSRDGRELHAREQARWRMATISAATGSGWPRNPGAASQLAWAAACLRLSTRLSKSACFTFASARLWPCG